MPSSALAARVLRFVASAVLLASAAHLAACGSDGKVSAFLPPGPTTKAPPGNIVLYAAMAQGNRIDAYRLGTDGLLPKNPSSSIFLHNPRRLAQANGVLYAALSDRIVSIRLGADGSLPNQPTAESTISAAYNPVDLLVGDGELYVAAAGLERVESYKLDANGDIAFEPNGSGKSDQPGEYVSLGRDGDYLYSGSRTSELIDLFLLDQDGRVPAAAEPQVPQDDVSLPDHITIRNNVLYVTSGSDKCIRAYKIPPNGFLAGDFDSRTKTEDFYEDIILSGNILYAAAYNAGRIDLYHVDPDGMLPEEPPFYKTQDDPAAYPNHMILTNGILYVAQAGLDRVDAYVLDNNGVPPFYPSSSTVPQADPSYPLDVATYTIQ